MKNIVLTIVFIFMITTTFSQITNVGELKIEVGTEIQMEDFFSNNNAGSVINNGSITFVNTFTDEGITTISPSSSTIVNQDYKHGGVFEVTINGSVAGDALGYSQMNVDGNLTLFSSPTLNVTIEPSYLPSDGTSHAVITYSGSLSGTFDAVNIPNTGWYVDYSTPGEVNVIRDSVLDIENIDDASFSVYPNPTSGIINIQSKENIQKAELFDINGRLIFTKTSNSQMNISKLSVGVYMLKVLTENGKSSTKKIIKN